MRICMGLGLMLLLGITASVAQADLIGEDGFDINAETFTFTGYSPYSLTHITTDDFTVTGGRLNSDRWNFYNQCIIDFSSPVSAVGLGINRGKTGSITMQMYGTAGDLLEEHTFSGLAYPTFIGLDAGVNSIDWVSFTVNDDIFADRLVYQETSSASPVPAPAAVLLGVLGLSTATARIRRRRDVN